ncbi:MAG: multiheme c-type cytochrome [Anderseniella sp.]|jgi:predicted CXXCH cytochrome family protein|nr:multiheme c-type cytochrome [Anderseniella sp.]
MLLAALLVVSIGFAVAQQKTTTPAYVGSNACTDCHKGQSGKWARSHHALAWQWPSSSTVLGDFDNASFEHQGIKSRFTSSERRYFVETDGSDGNLHRFEVKSVAGIAPLQQYLLEIEPGRLQALDLAWDTERKRWYHLYPDQILKGGDGLHWTGPYKNWNARCAECHATSFDKNYDPQTRSYKSNQVEIGVGCEACHGPGEAHVAWARSPAMKLEERWQGLTRTGFNIDFANGSAETEIQQCAACHSRREPLDDGNPLPGTAYHDAYRLSLLRQGLYHADGSIQDEVYVYGSFLQSRMYARGVRCSDCHDVHSAGLKAEGNSLCTQCHSPAGNDRFPTLRKATYDAPSHHFHPSGSDGAQCKSCHMIERVYMGVDWRRDHSFRIPRPDLGSEATTPDACTDCHKSRDAAWAASQIAKRFPDETRRGPHFSTVFEKARSNQVNVSAELLAIAGNAMQAGIVRATALDLLRNGADEAIARRAAPLVSDEDPLVRAAAVELQRAASPEDRVKRLLPALEDSLQAVRISAARTLIGSPTAQLSKRSTEALHEAQREWRDSLLAKVDFPETHLILAGTALVLRKPDAAEQAFREAVRQDPQLVDAWRMIIRIRAALGDRQGALKGIEDAMSFNPGNPVLQSLRNQLE